MYIYIYIHISLYITNFDFAQWLVRLVLSSYFLWQSIVIVILMHIGTLLSDTLIPYPECYILFSALIGAYTFYVHTQFMVRTKCIVRCQPLFMRFM